MKEGLTTGTVAIPESQLSRWSNHGSQAGSKQTHETIRRALESHSWPEGETREFFLQGSYSNSTNIRGDSDVDVVLKLNDTFRYDHSELSPYDQDRLEKSFQTPTYWWDDFRRDALAALRNGFHQSVEEGNKSIKIGAGPSRLAADVVVCVEYRRYTSLESFVEGIAFYTTRGRHPIVNYPKEHRGSGAAKSARTKDRYKRTVRMFKNARNRLESDGRISRGLAPSYFLECLIYNAPDGTFVDSFQDTYCSIVDWMNHGDISRAVCQNEQQYLFGSSAVQWSLESAKTLSRGLEALWNDWD